LSVVWKPALISANGSVVQYIPRPISSLIITRNWKAESHEAPGRDGTDNRGVTVKGPEINITGSANIDGSGFPGTPITDEDIHRATVKQMKVLEELGAFLTTYDGEGFQFTEFWDGSNPVTRFKNCFPHLFNYDTGDGNRVKVPYTLILHVNNPRRYFNVDSNGNYDGTGTNYGPEFVGGD
jgi:hypothetical protein